MALAGVVCSAGSAGWDWPRMTAVSSGSAQEHEPPVRRGAGTAAVFALSADSWRCSILQPSMGTLRRRRVLQSKHCCSADVSNSSSCGGLRAVPKAGEVPSMPTDRSATCPLWSSRTVRGSPR